MGKTTSILKDIKSLGQLRDELKVQSHLFKVEMKKDWQKLEKDLKLIKRQIEPSKQNAKKSASEIKQSTQQLLAAIRSGYDKLKQTVPLKKSSR